MRPEAITNSSIRRGDKSMSIPNMLPNTPTTTTVEPISVVAQILQNQMSLSDAQICFTYQTYEIPISGIFCALGYGPQSKPISCKSFINLDGIENQELSIRHHIEIELMSFAPDNSARIRKEEVALALQSSYSHNLQMANSISIAWLPEGPFNISHIEENGVMLNKYLSNVYVFALHQKQIAADSIGTFPVNVIMQDGKQMEILPLT